MKKLLFLLAGIFLSFNSAHSQIKAQVDERFELTSIYFALAGVPEYCACAIPSYWADMNKTFFDDFTYSEPIHYARFLHQKHNIQYALVPWIAEKLEIVSGHVRLAPQWKVEELVAEVPHWGEGRLEKFIRMLDRFYRKSKFSEFYQSHRPLYDVYEQAATAYYSTAGVSWFESFFGKPFEQNLTVNISLMNGPHNYSMDKGVLLGMQEDKNGNPRIDIFDTQVLIHELCHHFTHPIFDSWWPQLEPAMRKIFPHIREQMENLAYPDMKQATEEWLNELCVQLYMREIKPGFSGILIASDVNRGFIWMWRSVDFMENFFAHRDRYPFFGDFMPQIVGHMNYLADNFELFLQEYQTRKPYVTGGYPLPGSDISSYDHIELTFSESMKTTSWGFNPLEGYERLMMKDAQWSEDGRKIVLNINKNVLIPGKMYGFKLIPDTFRSAYRLFQLDERCCDYVYEFSGK